MTVPSATSRRRVLQTTALTLTGVSLAGCSQTKGSSGDGSGDGATVEVGPNGNFVFTPGTNEPLRVPAGTEVTFDWKSDTHNVAVTKQPDGANWEGHRKIEGEGFSFSHTFETKGTYEYVCQPHESMGMIGEIVVE